MSSNADMIDNTNSDENATLMDDWDLTESKKDSGKSKKLSGGKAVKAGEGLSSNKKMIIGTAVVLILFVGIIFGPKAYSTFSAARANAAESRMAAAQEKPGPEPLLPPLLKEADMIGSVWNVSIKGFTLKVSFEADGKAVVGSDNMIVRQLAKAKYGVESLPGKWRIEGPKLFVSTSFEGKEAATDLTISGTKLVSKEGVPIVRVK